MKNRSFLFFFSLAVMLPHCVATTPRPYATVDANQIYRQLKEQQLLFQKEPIELEGKYKSLYSISFLIARPGFVKMSAPPSESDSKLILATDGNHFQLKDAQKSPAQFFAGPARPCVLKNLLSEWHLELSAPELVEILLGRPPLFSDEQFSRSEINWDSHGKGQEVLTIYGKDNQIQKVWLTSAYQGHVIKIEAYQDSLTNPLWRVEYKGFRKPAGFSVEFPEKTIFTNLKDKKDLTISWKKWVAHPEDLAEPWQDEFFVRPPASIPVQEVICEPLS